MLDKQLSVLEKDLGAKEMQLMKLEQDYSRMTKELTLELEREREATKLKDNEFKMRTDLWEKERKALVDNGVGS
jgi:hypothetical protein